MTHAGAADTSHLEGLHMMIYALCLAILAAPYTEYSRGLSAEWIEGCELNRHVRDMAIAAGLDRTDANILMIDLVGAKFGPPDRGKIDHWKKKGFDLYAFLRKIRELEGLPFSEKHKISQLNLLLWMSVSEDQELHEWFIQIIEARMKEPIKTEEDIGHMSTLLIALGYLRRDRALDILFWFQSQEAWANDPPIRIEIDGMTPECRQVEEICLRQSACSGIARSGTDRALHAFATGDGLAEDMGPLDSYFRTAAHAHCGIYGIFTAYRKGLEPEVKAALMAVFEKYGMEYPGEERYRSSVLF